MKKIAVLLIMTLMMMGLSMASMASMAPKNVPAISFVKKTYDFGTIKESAGSVSCEFKFTNTGKAPLVIVSAIAGCGCTKPTFEGEPIAPGKASSIKVTYNPKGRPGEFSKNVTIRTNDPKNKKVVLKITGVVVP